MNTTGERQRLKNARIADITEFVRKYTDQKEANLPSLHRMTEQDLHLLAAAIDNV